MPDLILPSGRHDKEGVENLHQYSSSEIQPYIPELLQYLADQQWTAYDSTSKLLGAKFSIELVEPLSHIFESDDEQLKRGCLLAIINYPKSTLDLLFPWIEKLATAGSFYEVYDGVQKYAARILFERFPEKYTCYNKQQFIDFLTRNRLVTQEQVQLFDFAKSIDIKKYKDVFKIMVCNQYDPHILTIAYIASGAFWMADLKTVYLNQFLSYAQGLSIQEPGYEVAYDDIWLQYELHQPKDWFDSLIQINLLEVIESISQAHQKVIDMRGI